MRDFTWIITALVIVIFCRVPVSPAASSAAAPAPASGAAAQPKTPAEWDRIVAAAKQEGKVAVVGAPENAAREPLTRAFQRKYGIAVEYLGIFARELTPRLNAERSAGQYLWDIYVHGTTTALTALVPAGMFDPLEPTLVLPEVIDLNNWRGRVLEFADSGRRVLVMTPSQRGTLFVNKNLVSPGEIRSYKDLLEPKWKGKLVMDDPRRAGPGQGTFSFFYMHPGLGADFIRSLARQQPALLHDFQQEIDAVGLGRFPVLVGGADDVAEERIRQGVPILIVDPRKILEGTYLSPANGAVALFNRYPHPNAAKLYLNWLLSKEGQTAFAVSGGYVSARLDVPTDYVSPWRAPTPGAVKTYDEAALAKRDDVLAVLREAFGR